MEFWALPEPPPMFTSQCALIGWMHGLAPVNHAPAKGQFKYAVKCFKAQSFMSSSAYACNLKFNKFKIASELFNFYSRKGKW